MDPDPEPSSYGSGKSSGSTTLYIPIDGDFLVATC
jgi:hypothetical protein